MTPTPPEGPDQGPEHNPDNLSPEQYGAPEWRLLRVGEFVKHGDEWIGIDQPVWTLTGNPDYAVTRIWKTTYRRRVAPEPTPGSTPRTGTVTDCMVGSQEGLNTHPATQGQRIAELERENAGLRVDREMRKIAEDELADISKLFPVSEESGVLEAVRATIETLTRERDDARAAKQKIAESTAATIGKSLIIAGKLGCDASFTAEKVIERVDDVLAQLAASEKDRERLDWLERIDHQKQLFGNWIGGGGTLRAAIDAAMKEAK